MTFGIANDKARFYVEPLKPEQVTAYNKAYAGTEMTMGTMVDREYNDGTKTLLSNLAIGYYLGLRNAPMEGIQVCDFGSGNGIFAKILAGYDFPFVLYPLEISEQACRRIAKLYESMDSFNLKNVNPTLYGGKAMPFEDNSLGIVVAADVMEHVQDLNTTVSEIVRVLEPGGIFAMNIPLPNFERNYILHKLRIGDYRTLFEMGKIAVGRIFKFGHVDFQGKLGETRMGVQEWADLLKLKGLEVLATEQYPDSKNPLSGIVVAQKPWRKN